jgi:HK97 family phage portal protein
VHVYIDAVPWWNPFSEVTAPYQPAEEMEERAAQYSVASTDPAFLSMMAGYSMVTGAAVSEQTAMTLSAVFRAASLVSGALGQLPLRTLIENATGQTERSSSFLDNPGGDRYIPFDWKQMITLHLLFHGDAYLQHIRNAAGALVWLNPIHPSCVEPEWNESRPGGKTFTYTDMYGKRQIFDASNMTQIMGPSFDGLTGIGVISKARLSLGTALSGDKAAFRTFQSGAMISGLVTPADDGEDMEEEEAKEVKKTINRVMSGPENAGDIPVFNKRLKFQSWQLSNTDAQFLESRTYSIDEVGRWFGVPPHLLGLVEKSTSWGQGIQEQNRGLARYTLMNWTTPIQEHMTRLVPTGKKAEFDYKAFVKPSPEDEIKLLLDQVNSGLLTLNEARDILNLAPLPVSINGVPTGADLPRIPAGAQSPAEVSNDAPEGNDKGVTP